MPIAQHVLRSSTAAACAFTMTLLSRANVGTIVPIRNRSDSAKSKLASLFGEVDEDGLQPSTPDKDEVRAKLDDLFND
jgi:hypothetical protein